MKLKERISWLMGTVQRSLLPYTMMNSLIFLLPSRRSAWLQSIEIVQVEKHVPMIASTQWLGRKSLEREALTRSFVAKALYRQPTTRDLIRALESAENLRRLCGFMTLDDVPLESTVPRAFAEFAKSDLGNRVHGALVKDYLSGELIGHISRDATAITGREKPVKKIKKPKKPAKRGRPAKDEHREAVPEKRLGRQVSQSAAEAISELPTACDRGTKKNAKGYKTSWNGFKLHLDTTDVGLPISALVTSASLHDCQVAIQLIKLTSNKMIYLYDLMDAAYDAARIDETSRQFNHVPIIDKNARGNEVIPMAPHEAERYKGRSVAELANSRLKEDFGADNVMVRGTTKVTVHLMFGVVTCVCRSTRTTTRLDCQRPETLRTTGDLRSCRHEIALINTRLAQKLSLP